MNPTDHPTIWATIPNGRHVWLLAAGDEVMFDEYKTNIPKTWGIKLSYLLPSK